MTDKTLDQICGWYKISIRERKLYGTNQSNNAGYIEKGCFNCNGYDNTCQIYNSNKKHNTKINKEPTVLNNKGKLITNSVWGSYVKEDVQ